MAVGTLTILSHNTRGKITGILLQTKLKCMGAKEFLKMHIDYEFRFIYQMRGHQRFFLYLFSNCSLPAENTLKVSDALHSAIVVYKIKI